mmetsp:Transcript_28534/g.64907  ORF Transcript_28534/g.64907 Transcript_28534/m.64907 type:complete len:351 (-) Transcript_28534:50-1102(-)
MGQSRRNCPICSKAYGGAVLPALLVCCGGHLCVDCAEGHRESLLQADRKPQCAFCETIFQINTPWAINRPFIEEAGITCDLPSSAPSDRDTRDTQSGAKRRRLPGGLKTEECATDDEEDQDTDDGESDGEESRFSQVSEIDDDGDDEMEPIAKDSPSPEQIMISLPHSKLVTRKQLNYITGGERGGCKNPLQAGTPLSFVGGRAFAFKGGKLHHVCIKEFMNHPLPRSVEEEFSIYRCASSAGRKDIGEQLEDFETNPAVPIFWEPAEQPDSKTKISYVGHWKIVGVKKYLNNPFVYKNSPRCGIVGFRFVRYDESWNNIIGLCHDKTIDEIKRIDWRKEGQKLEEEVDY